MNILLAAVLMTSPAPAQPRAALPEAYALMERLAPRAAFVEIGRAARTPLEERLRLALEDGPAPACAEGRRAIKTGEPDEPYRCVRWSRRASALAGDDDELVGQRLIVAARDPR